MAPVSYTHLDVYKRQDHLWPWTSRYWRHHKAIEAAGLAFAIAVTAAWGLAANGQIGASTVIGWWLGWSIYEAVSYTHLYALCLRSRQTGWHHQGGA